MVRIRRRKFSASSNDVDMLWGHKELQKCAYQTTWEVDLCGTASRNHAVILPLLRVPQVLRCTLLIRFDSKAGN